MVRKDRSRLCSTKEKKGERLITAIREKKSGERTGRIDVGRLARRVLRRGAKLLRALVGARLSRLPGIGWVAGRETGLVLGLDGGEEEQGARGDCGD